MLKVVVGVAALLVAITIVYGTLQAEETFNESTSVTAVEAVQEELTPAPAREFELTGSDILYQVRGGDDACRFLHTGNRIGTVVDTELKVWFVAGVWETDLAATNEMHLYGPNGPHQFEIVGPNGSTLMSMDVGYGATEYATVTFPEVGVYYLYERLQPAGVVGEIFARPVGQPGSATQTEWCPS